MAIKVTKAEDWMAAHTERTWDQISPNRYAELRAELDAKRKNTCEICGEPAEGKYCDTCKALRAIGKRNGKTIGDKKRGCR